MKWGSYTVFHNKLYFPTRVLIATPSPIILKSREEPAAVRMRTLRSQTLLIFFRVQFPFCNLLERNTYRYGWSKREYTRISRVQATAPFSEAAWTKMNMTCLWAKASTPFSWSAKRSWAMYSACRIKARKQRSDSKLKGSEIIADVSVEQPSKWLAGCWIKAKIMLATTKNETTTATRPDKRTVCTTSNVLFRDVSKDKQGLDMKPCSQILISGFSKRVFPLLLEESFWQQGKTSLLSLNMPFPVSQSSQQYILYEQSF